MVHAQTIHGNIQAYCDSMTGEHHRYRSWEHCHSFFRKTGPGGLAADRSHAALQLAHYLASWGMYRGSSFLLQYAYTVHLGVVDLLGEPRFLPLWDREFGARDSDTGLVPTILDAVAAVRHAYKAFVPAAKSGQPTDTLVTKVLLGTLGCLPACDRYFINGFKSAGLSFSYVNGKLVHRVLHFCRRNLSELLEEQARIHDACSLRYPLMKLIDMYFWQVGVEMEAAGGLQPDG